MKKLDKSLVGVLVLIVALLLVACLFESYRGQLFSAAGFITFLMVLHFIDESFSKNPAAGKICVALTDLNPEGKIEFANEPTDARASKGYMIKRGQECEIIDFKKGIFGTEKGSFRI